MPQRIPRRLQLQLEHLQDMIREQDRMVLADVEPTTSDREDMLDLLSSVKNSIETEGEVVMTMLKQEYESHCASLNELGYNVAPYVLETPAPQNAAPKSSMRKGSKPGRKVHFERSIENVYGDDPQAEQPHPLIDEVREEYRDHPEVSSQQLFDDNRLLLEDQDRRLENIGGSLGRQREMGEQIHGELTLHNDMLDDLESQVDRSGSRLSRLTSGVTTFNKKSREYGTCSIIMLLVLVLFIVLII